MPDFWPWIAGYFILGFMLGTAATVLFDLSENTEAFIFCGVVFFWPLFFWVAFLFVLKKWWRERNAKGN